MKYQKQIYIVGNQNIDYTSSYILTKENLQNHSFHSGALFSPTQPGETSQDSNESQTMAVTT